MARSSQPRNAGRKINTRGAMNPRVQQVIDPSTYSWWLEAVVALLAGQTYCAKWTLLTERDSGRHRCVQQSRYQSGGVHFQLASQASPGLHFTSVRRQGFRGACAHRSALIYFLVSVRFVDSVTHTCYNTYYLSYVEQATGSERNRTYNRTNQGSNEG